MRFFWSMEQLKRCWWTMVLHFAHKSFRRHWIDGISGDTTRQLTNPVEMGLWNETTDYKIYFSILWLLHFSDNNALFVRDWESEVSNQFPSLSTISNIVGYVTERTSYFWHVNYFDHWSHHIISPNGDDESHSAWMTFPDILNSVKARQTTSSSKSFELDRRIFVRSFITSDSPPRGELLGLHFETHMFPVANELDVLIPPLTMQLLHSWTTFSGDLHTSLLQQTGPRNIQLNIHSCSKSSNSIFAMSIVMHIPLRHLAAIILSLCNNYFLPSFLRDLQHKGTLHSGCH